MFWIVELFVWLLILSIVSSGIMLFRYEYKKNYNTYQIFLPDVDGLINGSPVRFMGIQIGYVNQVDIVGEDVYVNFVITAPKVKLPQGSRVTVEFFGLGGSKSLEVYPPSPTKAPSDSFLVAQSPKRIHDSLGLLNDMFDDFVNIAYDFSHFMNKIDIIKTNKPINANGTDDICKNANTFLNETNSKLDKMQKQHDKISNKIKKFNKGGKNGTVKTKN